MTEIGFIHLLQRQFLAPFCLFILFAATSQKLSHEMAYFVPKIAHLFGKYHWNQLHFYGILLRSPTPINGF